MKTNYLIIGAGPAGIFTALELIRNGHKGNEITIVEKGAAIEKRSCPKTHTGNCVGCKNCSITTGFSGAGAFSDGKLSLSPDVGGDLPELIGYDFAKELIDYADGIYLEFGADTRIEGIEFPEEIKKIRKRAIKAGLKLVDCPIRHLGTEKAQEIYYKIEQYLLGEGVRMHFNSECRDLLIENGVCIGAIVEIKGKEERVEAGKTIVAAPDAEVQLWLETLCEKYNILHKPGNR